MLGPLYRSRGASHQGSNFDLEEAHLLRQQEGREKEKSIHDILKKVHSELDENKNCKYAFACRNKCLKWSVVRCFRAQN